MAEELGRGTGFGRGSPRSRKRCLYVNLPPGARSRQGSLGRLSLLCPFGWVAPALLAGKPRLAPGGSALFQTGRQGRPQYRFLGSRPCCPWRAVVSTLLPDVLPAVRESRELCLSRPLGASRRPVASGRAAVCPRLCLESPQQPPRLVLAAPPRSPAGLVCFLALLSRVCGVWPLPVCFHLQSHLYARPEIRSHPVHRRRWPGALKSTSSC